MVAAVTFVLTAAPFIWLYLPKSAEMVVHSALETKDYLLLPADSLNLGQGSFLYGGLQRWLAPYFGSNAEHATGFTPALLLLSLASLLSVIRRPSRGGIPLAAGMGLAAIALWLASTRSSSLSDWGYLVFR